jgi:prephenate dehydrogenase
MTKLFNKVAIIGTGLIGGSIALDIKRRKLANKVIGVSRRKKSLLLAKKLGAIDYGSQEIDIIKGADLVIMATPVSTILNLSNLISKSLTRDCLVTDVGSTKKEIVAKLEKVFPYYVGSHPLAGSEKRGVVNACANIFKDSLCILTPTKNTDPKALSKIKKLWTQLGAKVKFLSPDEHDKILSFVSHLAHIVAFSLIDIIPRQYLKFASNGLKDTTRIAASEAHLWVDIFLSNQKNTLKTIELFQHNLSRLKSAIKKRDRKLLSEILSQAKNKRDSLD